MADTNGNGSSSGGESNRWRNPPGKTPLEALIEVADMDEGDIERDGSPWQPGYELEVVGRGGMVGLERRRVTVAQRGYVNQVGRNREVNVTGDYDLTVNQSSTVNIGGPPEGGGAGFGAVEWGSDKLKVEGDAKYAFGERKVMMTGIYHREWNGGIVRIAGMEGVICGGVFLRIHAGVSMSMSAINSGDVYIGVARFAGARLYLAGFQYRAAQMCMWNSGAYVRLASITVEPLLGVPSQPAPSKSIGSRLSSLVTWVGAFLPFVEIGIGLLMLPIGAVMGIVALIQKARGVKKPMPPPVTPRVRFRNGVEVRNTGLELTT